MLLYVSNWVIFWVVDEIICQIYPKQVFPCICAAGSFPKAPSEWDGRGGRCCSDEPVPAGPANHPGPVPWKNWRDAVRSAESFRSTHLTSNAATFYDPGFSTVFYQSNILSTHTHLSKMHGTDRWMCCTGMLNVCQMCWGRRWNRQIFWYLKAPRWLRKGRKPWRSRPGWSLVLTCWQDAPGNSRNW